jgi:transcriptional regulator with XRE-family HTH domain
MTETPTLGEFLSDIMKRRGITTYRLAKLCGRDHATVYKVCKGYRSPSYRLLAQMLSKLDLTPGEQFLLYEVLEKDGTKEDRHVEQKRTADGPFSNRRLNK